MRHDIQKVVFERQRGGSSERSQKTRMKLNPNLDYDSGETDWGPTYFSSARRRQEGHGLHHKSRNENTSPLFRFLYKSVGRLWNDVYSEICKENDPRTLTGSEVRKLISWYVDTYNSGHWRCRGGFYVDDDGIVRKIEQTRFRYPKDPITSLHWYDNVWFQLQTFKRPALCGCRHYKPRSVKPENWSRWRMFNHGPDLCIHGNEQIPESIWYVVENAYHAPDEVYDVYSYETCGDWYRTIYNLKQPGDKHFIYYRDHPKLLEKPIEIRKKVANRKELKVIRAAIKIAA